eukprot:TRINITY_DN5295_c0_g1_i2.p1 TRINITY_DN5295_c0_g1~~TRINITY_DN5295_c0_g1_i2.p1  ORF type:complete len:191 (-),score=21.45 TRINITY_DN5295_c0_g1_i2:121-693(-)
MAFKQGAVFKGDVFMCRSHSVMESLDLTATPLQFRFDRMSEASGQMTLHNGEVYWLDKNLYLVAGLSLASRQRFEGSKLRGRHDDASLVSAAGSIYCVGGHECETNWFATVRKFIPSDDGKSGEWKDCAPMPTARAFLAAVEHNGRVYAIGGYNGKRHLNTVESYDPVLDAWRTEPKLPVAGSRLSAVSI